jgi:hypothetical protein
MSITWVGGGSVEINTTDFLAAAGFLNAGAAGENAACAFQGKHSIVQLGILSTGTWRSTDNTVSDTASCSTTAPGAGAADTCTVSFVGLL